MGLKHPQFQFSTHDGWWRDKPNQLFAKLHACSLMLWSAMCCCCLSLFTTKDIWSAWNAVLLERMSTMDKEWQGHVWNFLAASFSGTPHHLYQHFHGNTATENACRPILDLQPGGLRPPNMRQARTWKTFRCLCCPSLISKTLGNAKWTFWQSTNSACWKMVVASVFCEQVWKLGLYE